MAQPTATYLLDKVCNKLKQFVMRAIEERALETYRLPNGVVYFDPEDDHLLLEEALANISTADLHLLAKASGCGAKGTTVRSDELFRFEFFMVGACVAINAWMLVVTRPEHDSLMNEDSRPDDPTYSVTEHEFEVRESWERCLALRERVAAHRRQVDVVAPHSLNTGRHSKTGR